jgi:hypothetical protein
MLTHHGQIALQHQAVTSNISTSAVYDSAGPETSIPLKASLTLQRHVTFISNGFNHVSPWNVHGARGEISQNNFSVGLQSMFELEDQLNKLCFS